jgi:hypothetical protein
MANVNGWSDDGGLLPLHSRGKTVKSGHIVFFWSNVLFTIEYKRRQSPAIQI